MPAFVLIVLGVRFRRFLNFKLDNIRVIDEAAHPHMVSSRSVLELHV